ncbi:restriction endonuclease subunit S [Paenibacillus sp. BK720]|uniref:restriction endonuclease subunit S n=1 Tax=Paenibacillus sp. BK720 TaxID=2587092 RepID=UPI0014238675|nr:restriction endonuclease subunit S [Paenibacillus sp. BK720]NIK70441.1 type I restriction enzyme S subunit [Paenibacillus sp. BK720]
MSFETISLQEVADVIDSLHKTPQYSEEGYPIIRVTDIKGGYLDFSQALRVNNEVYEEFSKKYKPQIDDILVSRVGSYGNFSYVNSKEPFCLGQNTAIIVPKKVNSKFLYFWLTSKFVKEQIEERVVGSTQKTLSLKNIKELRVPKLSNEEQLRISKLLSLLEEKININNSINKNLDVLAQALFKRWFVDFEFPNENGEPYKSSGGELEESGLGLMPKGWRVGALADLGEVVGGATPSKSKEEYYTPMGIPWITPKDLSINKNKYISRGQIDITEEGFKSSSTRLVPKGTVLFSSRAPIGYIAISKNEMTTNQGFKSLIPFKHIGSEFLYYVLKFNTETIESRASGSTFKEISGSEMKRDPVTIPSFDVIERFNIIVESVGKMVEKCESESDSLIQLRDSLLPKLMSGEIRVPLKQDCLYSHSIELPLAAENKVQYTTT